MDFTTAVSTSLTRSVSITILLLTLICLPSTLAIDCGGKPFHCENSTHFKICVDFGNGVSSTVDDFVIPCPPGTECRGINHFECEFIPPTTPATIDSPSDVMNDTKVTDDITVTTPMLWEVVTTILPPGSRHDKEYSERYLNTAKPGLGSSLEPTDLTNDTEVIITTKLPETVSGTIAYIASSENAAETSTNMTTLAPELLYTSTLVINEHDLNTNKSSGTFVRITNEVINETVQNSHITSAIVNETTTETTTGLTSFKYNNEQESIISSNKTENVSVTHDSVNETFQNAEESNNDIYKVETITTTTSEHLNAEAVDNEQESYKNSTKTENDSITQQNVQSILKNKEITNKTLQVEKYTTTIDQHNLDDLEVDRRQETVLSSTTTVNDPVAQENSNQTFQNKENSNETYQQEKIIPPAGSELFDTSTIDNGKTSRSKADNISFTNNTASKADEMNEQNSKNSTYNFEIRTPTNNPELLNILTNGQKIDINTTTTENVLRSQESVDKTSQNVGETNITNVAVDSGLDGDRSSVTTENILIAQDSSKQTFQNEKEGNEVHQLKKPISIPDQELFDTMAISVPQDRLNETLQNEESSNKRTNTVEKTSPTGEAGITQSTREKNISITLENINKNHKNKELSTTSEVEIENRRTSEFLNTPAAHNELESIVSSTTTEHTSVDQYNVNKTIQYVEKINDNTNKNAMKMSEITVGLANTLAMDNGRKSDINNTTTEKVSVDQQSLNRTYEIVEESDNNTNKVENITFETASDLVVSKGKIFTSSTKAENNLVTQNKLNETLQTEEDNNNLILSTFTRSSAVDNEQESITSNTTPENDLMAQDTTNESFQYIGQSNNNAFGSEIVTSVTAPEFLNTFDVKNGNEGFISSSTTTQVSVIQETRNENIRNVEENNNITYENEITTSVTSSEYLDTSTVDNVQENVRSSSKNGQVVIAQDTINENFQNLESKNSANKVVIVASVTAPDILNTLGVENGEKTTSTIEAENVSVNRNNETGISQHKGENNNATYKVNIKATTIISAPLNTLAVTNSQENSVKTETTQASVNDNNASFKIETKTSTDAPELSHTLPVDNRQNVTYRPNMLNLSTEAIVNEVIQNQAISETYTEVNTVANITTISPQELNISSMNENLGNEITETMPNQQFSETTTNEHVIETTTMIQFTSHTFAANTGLEISTSAPTSIKPVQNIYITDTTMPVTRVLPLEEFNDSEISSLQELIPSDATTGTGVFETLGNTGTVRNVVNIEGSIETTTAALVGNMFSEIYMEQPFANKPFLKNISTNNEVLEEVIRKDVTLQRVLVTNNSVSVTKKTDAVIIDGSQLFNNDQSVTENGVSNNIHNVTTQGYMIETVDSESTGVIVPIKDKLGGGSKNITNSTAEMETQFDMTLKSQNTTTERTEVTVQFHDIITQMKSSVEELPVKESTLINEIADTIGVTKSSDLINTMTSNEETMLERSHYQILPFITSFDKHKKQGTTISAQDFSSFVGTGLQSEGISANEGWLVLNDGDTTTESTLTAVTNKSKMRKTSLINESDITTLSSLAYENNRVITGMFESLAEQITPSNNRFTVKNIQDKEITAAGPKIENNPWDPSDGLLMHMPNVVFELDKNTDSLSIDETSYLGQGQEKTSHNNAFSILSETIPRTINKQGPSSENVIETGASYVEITGKSSVILGTGVTKSVHTIGNTEKNTIPIRSQTSTEGITVPVKGTNEQFIQNNSTDSVTKTNVTTVALTSEKNGQSTSTKTNSFLSNKETPLLGNINNGDKNSSIDIENLSLFAPARDENQDTQNNNNNMTKEKQTLTLETSTVSIQPSFGGHNNTKALSATAGTKKNTDTIAIGRDHLDGSDFTMTPLLSVANSSIIVDFNRDFTLESSSKVSSNKNEFSGASTDTEVKDDLQSVIQINNTGTVISQQTTKSTEILSDKPRYTPTEEISFGTSHGILGQTTASTVTIKGKEQNIFQVNSDKKLITSSAANSSRQGDTTNRPAAVNPSPLHTDKIEVGGGSTDTDVSLNIQINENTVLKQESTKSIRILPNKPRDISVKQTSSAMESSPMQEEIGQSTLTAGVDMSTVNEKKSVVEGANTEAKTSPKSRTKETSKIFTGIPDGHSIKHEIYSVTNDNGEVTKSLQTTSTPPSVENFHENTQATVSLTTIPSSKENITRHFIKTAPISKPVFTGSTSTVTANSEKSKNQSSAEKAALSTNAYDFDCTTVARGRISDNFDCRKFYICIDKQAIVGYCPYNTVFSPIKKQCTKNLSHCIRGEEFQCTAQGRFVDILRENIYYICVKNPPAFIRFKFQCQNGFTLNKSTIRCERTLVSPSLLLLSTKGRTQSSQMSKKVLEKRVYNQKSKESNDSDVSRKDSEQSSDVPKKYVKKSNSDEPLEVQAEIEEKNKSSKCTREGKIPHPEDCRKYYVCYKNKKSELRRKRKKCDSDELFDSSKSKCVDSESYECNLG